MVIPANRHDIHVQAFVTPAAGKAGSVTGKVNREVFITAPVARSECPGPHRRLGTGRGTERVR